MNKHISDLLDVFAPHFDARHETEQRFAAMPEPSKDYVIFMTPRSGSTWLCDVLTRHAGFGEPEEYFNIEMMAPTRSASLDRYMRHLRKFKRDPETGVFGAKITFFQLDILERLASFFDVFNPHRTQFFYLTRSDVIAQAVSFYKARHTQRWHSFTDPPTQTEPPYDEAEIFSCLEHMLQQEEGFEQLFKVVQLTPVRLVYEDIIEAGAADVCRLFCDSLGIAFKEAPSPRVHKIATSTNEEFAQRFAAALDSHWLRDRRVKPVQLERS